MHFIELFYSLNISVINYHCFQVLTKNLLIFWSVTFSSIMTNYNMGEENDTMEWVWKFLTTNWLVVTISYWPKLFHILYFNISCNMWKRKASTDIFNQDDQHDLSWALAVFQLGKGTLPRRPDPGEITRKQDTYKFMKTYSTIILKPVL